MSDETKTTGLLDEFKRRNHIFHDSENESLDEILNKSRVAIKRLVGSDDITDLQIAELVLERSRYVYNDALEYFDDNFQSELIGVSLNNYSDESGVADDSNEL